MKRCLALLLALLLGVTGITALAEDAATPDDAAQLSGEIITPGLVTLKTGDRTQEEAYEELIVGSTTAMTGDFFTGMWGNSTCDIDVRDMIHGYATMQWVPGQGMLAMDASVVSGVTSSVAENGDKTYNLTIYSDLFYNDGTPITARDYVFSVLLSAAPEIAANGGLTTGADYIVGSDEYRAGTTEVFSGVRLISDTQFSVTVKAAYLPFFYELSLLTYNPYPIDVIAPGCEVADDGAGVYIRNIDQTVEEPIFTAELLAETVMNPETGYRSHPTRTSGPYTLTGYDGAAKTATFEINPYYKGDSSGQRPAILRVIFKTVQEDTMMDELENGTVDLLNKCVRATTIEEGMALVSGNLARQANYLRVGLSLINFCCEDGPVVDADVRKAVALCLDKSAFASEYAGLYGLTATGYFGVGQWMAQLVNGTIPAPVEAPAEGADAETLAAYDALIAQWDALNLDNLDLYAFDTQRAAGYLVADGWTLNEAGEAFDPEKDAVRCKLSEDGAIVPLRLTMIVPEGNAAAVFFGERFAPALAEAGIALTVETKPFAELLRLYYRQDARDCDMIYLATNFLTAFDPSYTYSTDDAAQGIYNTSGLRDETLMNLARDLRATPSGDVLTYCQKWIAFQEYWNQTLPSVPVYSNIYFDFFTPRLQNYLINGSSTWAQAILYAYLGDPIPEPVVDQTEEPAEDGETVIIE